jgi:hypothetical protein
MRSTTPSSISVSVSSPSGVSLIRDTVSRPFESCSMWIGMPIALS